MSELIVLCAASASDRDSEASDPRHFAALFAPAAVATRLRTGGFARAFGRARVAGDAQDDALLPRELPHERWLRKRCALAAGDSVEAWSAAACGSELPAWRLTPVHIRVGQDQLTVTDPAGLDLDERHWRMLAGAAAPAFAGHGLTLHAADAIHWFASGARPADWRARSWTMACGRSADAYLPEGADAREWRRLLTEVQMTWHDHPANREREAQGLPPVNALWLDGLCSGAAAAPARTVFTSDAAIEGLALAAGAEARRADAPGPDAATLAACAGAGDVLVDLDAWRAPCRAGDARAWLDAWLAFDGWIGSLAPRGLPPAGFARMLAVFTGERRSVELAVGRGGRWQFWRRVEPAALVLLPR